MTVTTLREQIRVETRPSSRTRKTKRSSPQFRSTLHETRLGVEDCVPQTPLALTCSTSSRTSEIIFRRSPATETAMSPGASERDINGAS